MARKTVPVQDVKDRANYLIGVSESVEARRVVGALLESVLMPAGAYWGFRYAPSEINEDGTLRDDYDDSRRIYY